MKKLVLSGLCCAGLVALLPETANAHGGSYRGPGDVVPPSPGGGGKSGGPSGPTTGGPAGSEPYGNCNFLGGCTECTCLNYTGCDCTDQDGQLTVTCQAP